MDIIQYITIFLYMLSTAGYVAYLFFQQSGWQRAGGHLLLAGFVCHTALLLADSFSQGLYPGRNLYQTLVLAGWAFSGVGACCDRLVRADAAGDVLCGEGKQRCDSRQFHRGRE